MTRIITVAQRKGGAGKTTLVCQLLTALMASGRRVAAIDADDQASLSHWVSVRERRLPGLDFPLEQATSYGIASSVRRLRRAQTPPDFIFIDTPPLLDRSLSRAVGAADLVIVPLQLSPLDLDATMPTARVIGEAEKPVLFVVNRAPARARVADMIRTQLRQSQLPMARAELGNRAAFAESLASGQGVVETAKRSLAADEITALAREVSRRAGAGTRRSDRAA
ncbi:MAG: ParA family protein [Pseudomonadota bacterium]